MASPIFKKRNGVPPEHHMYTKQILVLGDEGIGKTSLIKYLIKDQESQPYALLIFSMYPFTYMRPDGEAPEHAAFMELTHGYEAEDRKSSYPYIDAVLACFAIDDPLSLEHVSTLWVPEIRDCQLPVPPTMLIGLKKDARTDPSVIQRLQDEGSSPVTEEQARTVAEALHIQNYIEFSTQTGETGQMIYDAAVGMLPV